MEVQKRHVIITENKQSHLRSNKCLILNDRISPESRITYFIMVSRSRTQLGRLVVMWILPSDQPGWFYEKVYGLPINQSDFAPSDLETSLEISVLERQRGIWRRSSIANDTPPTVSWSNIVHCWCGVWFQLAMGWRQADAKLLSTGLGTRRGIAHLLDSNFDFNFQISLLVATVATIANVTTRASKSSARASRHYGCVLGCSVQLIQAAQFNLSKQRGVGEKKTS